MKKRKSRNHRQNKIIKKRFQIVKGILSFCFLSYLFFLFQIQVFNQEKYKTIVKNKTNQTVEGESAPRGRIYDRNHKLIVDNIPVKEIVYKKESGVTKKEEVKLAYEMAQILEVSYLKLTEKNLKNFYLVTHNDGKDLIQEEEWEAYHLRKLTNKEIENLKLERINEEDLKEVDKEVAMIYTLMNDGYSYEEKVIKTNASEEEYAFVSEKESFLKGFSTKLSWERTYPYGEVFRSILGNISTIPKEEKTTYLQKGYSLNDRVGISYLEYQYEDYLKGTKDRYNLSGELEEKGSRGNDITLTIDIELQKEVESILVEQIKLAKTELNTEYYNHSFVVITDPNTGEILAMTGKQVVNDTVFDVTPLILTSPVTVGSAIKGASQIVGYNTGALKIGEVRDDSCIKLKGAPKKCSYRCHGMINDIEALKYSSNTYQFRTAIKVGNGNYIYNGPLKLNDNAFQIYRNTFKEFGLGIKTGIDLPIESVGYIGKSMEPGLLLDFAIGQYDTYTTIQLSSYIGTIATDGVRMQLHLLKEVTSSSGEVLFTYEPKILGTVNTSETYMKRMQEGLKAVLRKGGTGYGSMSLDYNPAGKTGTSQSFLDTDLDGKIDLETVSTTFVAYAPMDNPIVTFTVVSPDVSHHKNKTEYQTMVNRKISREVTKKFFEIYK